MKVEETKEELNDNETKTESSSTNEFPANMEVDLKEEEKEKQGITLYFFKSVLPYVKNLKAIIIQKELLFIKIKTCI